MKRMVLFALLCSFFCLAHAGSFADNFKRENDCFAMGLHFGAIGQLQDMGQFIGMLNFTIKGVYLDCGGMYLTHKSDVRIDRWKDRRAFLIHGGYTIPVTANLRFTPIVGYAMNERGYTDGSDWYADGYGIVNKFNSEKKINGLDFGLQVTGNFNNFNIYGTFTRYAWYIGFGVELRSK